jgi:uncharacterized RDD family membrane protein YckC
MSFDDTKTVVTPEQVTLTYALAGIGTRFGAMLLDTFAQGVAIGAIIALLMLVLPSVNWVRLSFVGEMAPSWIMAIAMLAFFGILWGYFIFWETVWSGRTPGKWVTGIRVVRDGGYPIDFRAAFVRNIVRYVDFLPAFYGTGALMVFLSRDSKRLGDYAAGTIVVVDARPLPRQTEAEQHLASYPLLGDPALLNLRALRREQFLVVERYLARSAELPVTVRMELARKIAEPLLPVIGLEVAPSADYRYDVLLAEIATAYRGLAGH